MEGALCARTRQTPEQKRGECNAAFASVGKRRIIHKNFYVGAIFVVALIKYGMWIGDSVRWNEKYKQFTMIIGKNNEKNLRKLFVGRFEPPYRLALIY